MLENITLQEKALCGSYLIKNVDLVALALFSEQDSLAPYDVYRAVKSEFDVSLHSSIIYRAWDRLTHISYIREVDKTRLPAGYRVSSKLRQITPDGKRYLDRFREVKSAKINPSNADLEIMEVQRKNVRRNLEEIILDTLGKQDQLHVYGILKMICLTTGVLSDIHTIYRMAENQESQGRLTSQKEGRKKHFIITSEGKEYLNLLIAVRSKIDRRFRLSD